MQNHNGDKILILLEHIPDDITEDDIADLIDHMENMNAIHIIHDKNGAEHSYAWIELKDKSCTQAGLNAICNILNHRYFKDYKIQAYPVLFSHH